MSYKLNAAIVVIGIDIGKNSFHVVGLDRRGAIVLRQRDQFVPKRQNWFRSALPWVSSVATLHRNEKQA